MSGPTIGHTLIVGATMSGKTTLAKKHARNVSDKGIPVMVLSAMPEEWDFADYKTDNPEEFLQEVFNHKNCLVIVDEAGEMVGRCNQEAAKLATRARHWGHQCMFLVQTGRSINPNIRDNCSNLFLFQSSRRTIDLLYETFTDDILYEAVKLPAQGECIAYARGYGAKRIKVFDAVLTRDK